MQSLHFLSVEMGFKNDLLAIPDQLFDFEASHDSLDTLVLHAVLATHFGHIVAVLFADVCAQLPFLRHNAVEDAGH